MTENKKILPELQVLSGIAILFVVLIHSNAYYLVSILGLQSYASTHFSANLLDNLIHGAVPIFVFLSGYKYQLRNSKKGYFQYVYRNLKKVLKPFLLISLAYILIDFISYPQKYLMIKDFVLSFIYIFIGNNIAYQLWYIPLHIFIIITYPLITRVFKNDFIRILAIIFIIMIQRKYGYEITMLGRLRFRTIAYYLSFVSYYVFFEEGVLLCKYSVIDKLKKYDKYIILVYIFAVIVMAMNSTSIHYEIARLYFLWPLSIIAYYLLSLKFLNSKIFKTLGQYSFYIFLFHEPIILKNICTLLRPLASINNIAFVLISAIVTISCTLFISKMILLTPIRHLIFAKNVSKAENTLAKSA